MIVYTGADDVVVLAVRPYRGLGAGRTAHRYQRVSQAAEIDIKPFPLHGPIARDHGFDAKTGRPASPDLRSDRRSGQLNVAGATTGHKTVQRYGRPDASKSRAAGPVEQDVSPGDTGASPSRRKPIGPAADALETPAIVRTIIGAVDIRLTAETIRRTQPIEVAFDTKHERICDTPIITALDSPNEAGTGNLVRLRVSKKASICIDEVRRARGPLADPSSVATDIKTGPIVDWLHNWRGSLGVGPRSEIGRKCRTSEENKGGGCKRELFHEDPFSCSS